MLYLPHAMCALHPLRCMLHAPPQRCMLYIPHDVCSTPPSHEWATMCALYTPDDVCSMPLPPRCVLSIPPTMYARCSSPYDMCSTLFSTMYARSSPRWMHCALPHNVCSKFPTMYAACPSPTMYAPCPSPAMHAVCPSPTMHALYRPPWCML